jgi:hypothetical protein
MSGPWRVVDRGALDVEDVPSPRAVLTECPACGRRARLVERELVRNLRVLGVPLLATERGARVFQCPSCNALCAREGDDVPAASVARGDDNDDRVEALTERVLKAEDEALLWRQRAAVAAARGDEALAAEMQEQSLKSERASQLLRREVAALLGARADRSAAEETAQGRAIAASEPSPAPPVVAVSETPAPQVDALEDELAALRARVADKRRPKESAAPAQPAGPAPATEPDDEVAALKAKLGRPAPPTAEAPTHDAPAEPTKPAAPPSDDDDLDSLKRSLRKKD